MIGQSLDSIKKYGFSILALALHFYPSVKRSTKLKLLLVILVTVLKAILLGGILSNAFGSETAFSVVGKGLLRDSESECLDELPKLKTKLEKLGLVFNKPLTCKKVAGNSTTFEPGFTAKSPIAFKVLTALAGIQDEKNLCETSLEALLPIAADEGEQVLESGCVRVVVLDAETAEASEKYQPMVVLMKRAPAGQ